MWMIQESISHGFKVLLRFSAAFKVRHLAGSLNPECEVYLASEK